MLPRYRRDAESLVLLKRYQALGLKPHQRFSNGDAADPVAVAQRFDAQTLIRCKPACDNIGAQLPEYGAVDSWFDSIIASLNGGHADTALLCFFMSVNRCERGENQANGAMRALHLPDRNWRSHHS